MKILRDELYRMVWNDPVTILAGRFHLSDVGFAKICRKMEIPLPPRGYWAMRKSGKKPPKSVLPKPKKDTPRHHIFLIDEKKKTSPGATMFQQLGMDTQLLVRKIQERRSDVRISNQFRTKDERLLEVRDVLRNGEPDDYGVVKSYQSKYFSIRVSPPLIDRSLLLLKAIVEEVESLGGQFGLLSKGYNTAYHGNVSFLDQTVTFSIEEKVDRSDYKPSKKQIAESEKSFWGSYPKWEYKPSGKLFFKIDFHLYGNHGLRKTWSDKNEKPLEKQIPEILIGIVKASDALRRSGILAVKESKLRELNLIKRQKLEKFRIFEEKQLRNLEEQSFNWEKSWRIRRLIKDVQSEAKKRNKGTIPQDVQEWSDWANKQAKHIDPVDSVLCELLNKKNE